LIQSELFNEKNVYIVGERHDTEYTQLVERGILENDNNMVNNYITLYEQLFKRNIEKNIEMDFFLEMDASDIQSGIEYNIGNDKSWIMELRKKCIEKKIDYDKKKGASIYASFFRYNRIHWIDPILNKDFILQKKKNKENIKEYVNNIYKVNNLDKILNNNLSFKRKVIEGPKNETIEVENLLKYINKLDNSNDGLYLYQLIEFYLNKQLDNNLILKKEFNRSIFSRNKIIFLNILYESIMEIIANDSYINIDVDQANMFDIKTLLSVEQMKRLLFTLSRIELDIYVLCRICKNISQNISQNYLTNIIIHVGDDHSKYLLTILEKFNQYDKEKYGEQPPFIFYKRINNKSATYNDEDWKLYKSNLNALLKFNLNKSRYNDIALSFSKKLLENNKYIQLDIDDFNWNLHKNPNSSGRHEKRQRQDGGKKNKKSIYKSKAGYYYKLKDNKYIRISKDEYKKLKK